MEASTWGRRTSTAVSDMSVITAVQRGPNSKTAEVSDCSIHTNSDLTYVEFNLILSGLEKKRIKFVKFTRSSGRRLYASLGPYEF